MGIAAELKPKSVLVNGGLAAEKLVSGEADIALQPASELLAVPGAVLVRPASRSRCRTTPSMPAR